MSDENEEQQVHPFQNFLSIIEGAVDQDVGKTERAVCKDRDAFLADPLSAWALTYLSAVRMREATSNMDFVKADWLVRPLDEIRGELAEEKVLKKQLKEYPSPQDKANARMQLAHERYKALTGENAYKPSVEGLKKIFDGHSSLVHAIGPDASIELITAYLSTKDPNVLVPASQVVLETLDQLKDICGEYALWESYRDIVAKGERKGALRRLVVDEKKLANYNKRLDEIRARTPAVDYSDAFNVAAAAALSVHDVKLSKKPSYTEIRDAWKIVADQQGDLAPFTHDALVQRKEDQLAGQSETPPAVVEASPPPSPSPENDNNADEAPTLGSGSLLGEDDIEEWQRRQGPG